MSSQESEMDFNVSSRSKEDKPTSQESSELENINSYFSADSEEGEEPMDPCVYMMLLTIAMKTANICLLTAHMKDKRTLVRALDAQRNADELIKIKEKFLECGPKFVEEFKLLEISTESVETVVKKHDPLVQVYLEENLKEWREDVEPLAELLQSQSEPSEDNATDLKIEALEAEVEDSKLRLAIYKELAKIQKELMRMPLADQKEMILKQLGLDSNTANTKEENKEEPGTGSSRENFLLIQGYDPAKVMSEPPGWTVNGHYNLFDIPLKQSELGWLEELTQQD